MQFRVNVTPFLKAIKPVIDASMKSITKDFVDNNKITILNTKDAVIVKAFNGLLSAVATLSDMSVGGLSYTSVSIGEATTNAKSLQEALESFYADELVCFELKSSENAREIVISMNKDAEQFQTLPCYDKCVNTPTDIKDVSSTIKISNAALTKSLNSVLFASGFEKTKPVFSHIALKTFKDRVRCVAGIGSRYAIADTIGNMIFESTPAEAEVLFHKDIISTLTKLVEASCNSEIEIKQAEPKSNPFLTVIQATPYQISLMGIDPKLKYGDENKVLNNSSDIKIVINANDFINATTGIDAARSEEKKKAGGVFPVSFNVDFANKLVTMKANDTMKSNRKIPIVDSLDNRSLGTYTFTSTIFYLLEIARRVDKNDLIQFEFFNHNTPEPPIIVRFFAKDKVSDKKDIVKIDSATGMAEQFTIFFVMIGA